VLLLFYHCWVPRVALRHSCWCGVQEDSRGAQFSSVQAAVDAIARGKSSSWSMPRTGRTRETSSAAAEKATPEVVNFVMGGRGEFCVPVLPDVCKRLEVWPLVDANTAPLRTAS